MYYFGQKGKKVPSEPFRKQIISPPLLITAASVPRSGPWITCHKGNELRDLPSSSAKSTVNPIAWALPLNLPLWAPSPSFCSLAEMWHQPLALFLMPNAPSTKQPLRGTCWKKVAISYESADVALAFFPRGAGRPTV